MYERTYSRRPPLPCRTRGGVHRDVKVPTRRSRRTRDVDTAMLSTQGFQCRSVSLPRNPDAESTEDLCATWLKGRGSLREPPASSPLPLELAPSSSYREVVAATTGGCFVSARRTLRHATVRNATADAKSEWAKTHAWCRWPGAVEIVIVTLVPSNRPSTVNPRRAAAAVSPPMHLPAMAPCLQMRRRGSRPCGERWRRC
jgi:hypothetical protein